MAKQNKKHAQDIATRFQVYLERLKANVVPEFVNVFFKVDANTRELLLSLDANKISDLSKRDLAKLLNNYNESNTSLLGQASQQLFDQLESIAGYSAAFEARAIRNLAKVSLDIPNYAEAYKDALARPVTATGHLLDDFVSGWSDAETERLNNVIQKAWADGWTVQQTVQAIRGTKAQNFEDGILATSRRNAESVARTSIQHVASVGRMSTWQKNSDVIDGYKWVSTLDSRTTQVCRSLDGRVFKVGDGPMPPAHINCRSTTVAELDPSLDFLDEGATRSSENGYVDQDLSYYDWLKDQPDNFQNEALGPVRAQLFRDGGLSADEFANLQLNKNFEPLTLAEMQALEPTAFEKAGITLPDR